MSVPEHYNNLDAALSEAWWLWSQGVNDRAAAFHYPICATVALDGRPRARIVILRGCDPGKRTLRFHTDRRSEKFTELSVSAKIALTAYDPVEKIQVRVEGFAVLHLNDHVAEAAWDSSRRMSKVCYGILPAPGVGISGPGEYSLPEADEEIAVGREHFCAVEVHVSTLEWVYLAHQGHRRARFVFERGAIHSKWLAP